MSTLLNCFSHVNKRRILNLLHDRSATIADCARVLGINRKLAYAHINELNSAGLLLRTEFGKKSVLYEVHPKKRLFVKKIFKLLEIKDPEFESDISRYKEILHSLDNQRIIRKQFSDVVKRFDLHFNSPKFIKEKANQLEREKKNQQIEKIMKDK